MSTAKTKARAARSPRAATWYATPREKGWAGCTLMRRGADGRAREWARCQSHTGAEQLARALNRGERDAGTVEGLRGALHGAADHAERLHSALRLLVSVAARVPVRSSGGRFALALEAARRALGDEPAFAPGGEEVAHG